MAADFRVTLVYDRLLRGSDRVPLGLGHLHVATAEQLCRLHYSPGALTMVKTKLKELREQGYVQADVIPSKTAARALYYSLDSKGMQYLRQAGFAVEAWRAAKETDKSLIFLDHAFELNDLYIAAALLGTTPAGIYLHGFVHERWYKSHPYLGHQFKLIPDGFLDFRLSDGTRRAPIVLEHDRNSEGEGQFKQKVRAYIRLLQGEAYKAFFGVKTKITIAFTTFSDAEHVTEMRAWTLAELQKTNEPTQIGSRFRFAYLLKPPAPESWLRPVWYTAYEEGQPQALLAM